MPFESSKVFMRNFGNSSLDSDSLSEIYRGFLITFARQIGYGIINSNTPTKPLTIASHHTRGDEVIAYRYLIYIHVTGANNILHGC
jgi:hypothetical protein